MKRTVTTLSVLASCTALSLTMNATPAHAQSRYIGDIFIAGYTYCPRGTTSAEGQLLAISQFTALFSLYGTTYGGNGTTNFQLPDLRSRSPIGQGPGPGLSNYPQGAEGGVENITLTTNQLPTHSHTATVNVSRSNATTRAPTNAYFSRATTNTYEENTAPTGDTMNAGTLSVANTGNGQAYNNRNPYLSLRYCVVLEGIFPSRN